MRLKNALFLAILLIVVAAGCTGTGTKGKVSFDQNSGVKIDQFSFDVSELFEQDQATLTLKVQNVGAKSMSAKSVLWLYGPKMASSGDDVWSTTETLTNGLIRKELGTDTFVPPDVERGIPGSVDITSITLTAPTVPENMKRTDTFFARVCYPYNTTSMTTLVATTRNQLRTEAVKQTDAVTRASAGPIQLNMLSGENLVAGRPIQLVFDVTDVGGGFATLQGSVPSTTCTSLASADVPSKDLNKVKMTVKVDDVVACSDKTVTLSNGKGTLYCSLPASSTSNPKTTYNVIATASYNYFLTKEASLTVKNQAL